MFVWPDGSVTGSIHWARLQDIAASRSDESVTEDGWAALDALLAERVKGQDPTSDRAEQGYESQKVEDLKALLKARDLPTSGNKADLVERLQAADAKDADGPDVDPDDEDPEEE